MWERWATLVARHTWPFAIVGVVILLVIAWPVLSMRLGESDDGNLPTSTTQRQAYDLIAEGFGPGTNGPLLVVVQLPSAGDDAVLDDITDGAGEDARRRSRSCRRSSTRTRPSREIGVIPTTAPDSAQTADLVATLRDHGAPDRRSARAARRPTSAGVTAAFIDIGDRISDRLPYFIGAVVLLSFLLLMLVFHSILVPLTAAVMNLLSVAAAYGATVAVFQWGWAKDLIGLAEHRAHRAVRADDDVRGAVRAVDGLPGVPAHARPRGVRQHAATRAKASCAGSPAPRASSRRPR